MSQDLEALAKSLSLGEGVTVLAAHPCGLIALEKPTGTLSHPNDKSDRPRSLIRADYDPEQRRYHGLEDAGSVEEVFLVNRLDSATSGVILVCTNAELMPQVLRSFEKGRVKKTYRAIVKGRPAPNPRTWVDHIGRQKGPGSGVRVQAGGNMQARTEHKLVRMDANQLNLAELILWPITGRTHQLRFQCTRRRHPILGDANYGDFAFNKQFAKLPFARRLFLHSSSIELPLVIDGKNLVFKAESPAPEAFELLMAPNKDARQITPNVISKRRIIEAQRERFGRVPPKFGS